MLTFIDSAVRRHLLCLKVQQTQDNIQYKTKDAAVSQIQCMTHFYLSYHFRGIEVSHSATTDCHSHFERVRTDCALKKRNRVPPATFHVCIPSLSENGTNIFTLYIFKNISIIHTPIF